MYYNNSLRILIATILLTATGHAMALPYSSFDPRSLAMGGTGVASANSGQASFYNPALLGAPFKGDNFSLELPVVKAEYYDPDNLLKAAKDFNDADYVNALSNAITAYTNDVIPTAADKQAVVDSANNLIQGLQSISDKALQLDVDTAFVVAKPSRRLGMSLYFNAWVLGGGMGHFTSADAASIQSVADSAAKGQLITDPTNSLTSTVEARLALIGEIGVSLARQFKAYGQSFSVGVTPKFVRVQTYDYVFQGKQLDNAKISLSKGKKVDSNVNFDLGVAKDFGDEWRTGIAVKNLVSQTYRTAKGHTIKVNPQVRVGAAHHNSWSTVSVDLDLTKNDPAGLEAKTRYFALGAEFDAWHWAQLRVGYRYNIEYGKTSIFTGGIGLSPFGVHLDLAVAGNAHEIAAAMQTGFRF